MTPFNLPYSQVVCGIATMALDAVDNLRELLKGRPAQGWNP